MKAASHAFFLCTTVRGLARLWFSLFRVSTSILRVCLGAAAASIDAGCVLLLAGVAYDSLGKKYK